MRSSQNKLAERQRDRDERLRARWEARWAARRCPGCGGPFPPPKDAGRPRRWCSDKCRKGGLSVVERNGLACERCGEPIEAKPTGRVPKWCSAKCRRAAYDDRRILAAAKALIEAS